MRPPAWMRAAIGAACLIGMQNVAAQAFDHDTGNAFSGGAVIDQTAPRYARAMDATAEASQALERAIEALQQAQAHHRFEGLNYERLVLDIDRVRNALEPVLVSERRRLRYQTLQPDGVFMQPRAPFRSTD